MKLSPVRLAVQRPVTTLMLLVSILLLGGIALTRLPLAFLPDVDIPFIVVEVQSPNSSPAQVEEEITEPLEEALATLPGVRSMNSYSEADSASVFIELSWGQSLDVVRMQVGEKLARVKPTLPENAQRVLVHSFNTSDIPVVEARVAAEGVDLSASYPLLEAHVLDPIRRLPGVARVELDGVLPRDVFVDLRADKIREHNVDVGDLVQRLQSATAQSVLGRVTDGGQRYVARGLGTFETLEELEAMPVGIGNLRLKDLADVSYEEPPIGYGRHLDGEYAVGLRVFKESTANTVQVVYDVIDTIENDIDKDPRLKGVELFVWENQADHIRAGIDGLQRAGLIGAFMAIVCLYFFLRRAGPTLIVAMSIPFSVITACGVLYFMGKSLNLLSMMGLMLGVGMLVDNAIVVLEAIDRRRDVEPDSKKAALVGARSVTMAVVAATATTLIVFLPLVVGSRSQLTTWLGEVGVTISLALVCSLLSSLTLIPLVASRLRQRVTAADGPRRSRAEELYGRMLGWTLRRKGWAALILVLAVAVGIVPLATGLVSADSFSATVNDRLHVRYDFHDFHYKSQAEGVVDEVERYLEEHRAEFQIEELYSYYTENDAGTVIVLARDDLGDEQTKELRKKIRDGLPEIAGVKLGMGNDDDQGEDATRFSVQLYGRDGEVLRGLARKVEAELREHPDLKDVYGSDKHGRDEIQVSVDQERGLRRGISAQNTAETFGFALGGTRLPAFRDGEREVDTWLALRLEDRAGLDDLRGISFPVDEGRPVELNEIADFDVVAKPRQIVRQDRQGNSWVRATYEGEDWGVAREKLEEQLNAMSLPVGYTWSWDQRILREDEQNEQMIQNFLLALVLVYLVLAALFESVTQPIAIILSILFGLPGAVLLLWATSTPLNLMAQIGLLILMGVVVNNGVVLLDRVNQLRAEGVTGHEAFIAAGRDRLRPILMTATTTIFGLLPLALGGSTVGGLFYFPLARCVMGGLITSALFCLFGLPLVTMGIEFIARTVRGVWHASAHT